MPNEMSNEELASKLEKVLPGNYYIVEAAKRLREFEELKFNHLPKVEHALQRANTAGMECDKEIAKLKAWLKDVVWKCEVMGKIMEIAGDDADKIGCACTFSYGEVEKFRSVVLRAARGEFQRKATE